ncbi:MAG TPA: FKBP-type peptidyl-prolyl cis-trans isomerase [Chitinophagaceae bacterium]|nr:FKBP-type peptidyl-prolyl cis-trans isomerase [Chitinophagaceae bacterium]
MKTEIRLFVAGVFAIFMVSCGTDYKKTKSGLVYKIFPGDSKDSVAKSKNVLKFNFIRKINDSLLYTTYGKMPAYQVYTEDPGTSYSPLEVLFMMKKGDSAIVVESFDTLIKKGMQAQIPYGKKGDQIKTYIKIIEIFRSDSIVEADYKAEVEKDKPRREQEAKDMQAKQVEELKKSGEIEKEEKEIEAYLAARKITTVKAPAGTYVFVKEKGNGQPAVNGKFITAKYAGRFLATDSLFEANEYIFELGKAEVIKGWDDGFTLFNEGGKGTLFVPGYLAYGKGAGPGGKPFESLVFDIEVLNVSNTQLEAYNEKRVADSIAGKPPQRVQ